MIILVTHWEKLEFVLFALYSRIEDALTLCKLKPYMCAIIIVNIDYGNIG